MKLYGHRLPILCHDTTDTDTDSQGGDSWLVATGSTDKDIRLWDGQFGHCVKSLFAHHEAVTCLRLVKETHYLVSGGRDGHVKFWDADTCQLISDLQECLLEVRGLAVGDAGEFILTGGLDEGLRLWTQSNEQTIATDM